jgi:hypothetical protein
MAASVAFLCSASFRRVGDPDAGCCVSLESKSSYDYVIITNEDLMSASGPSSFWALAAAKEVRGISTIITTEWISVAYSGLRLDGGQDLQTKIRSLILDACQTQGRRMQSL